MFAEGKSAGVTLNVAMRTQWTNAIAVYLSSPSSIKLHLDKLTGGTTAIARWSNPATGREQPAGQFPKQPQTFAPPSGWADALLHIASKPE